MFLSHRTIEKYLDEGKILIEPEFDQKNIRPAGIRVHLGKEVMIPEPNQVVSITDGKNPTYKEMDITKEIFYLEPGGFILASTYEMVQTDPDILPILDGRSTVARLGLTTHITASMIDGVYKTPQTIILEIKNVGNFKIELKYRDPIALLGFAQLSEPITQKQQSQYQGQVKVTPPNLGFIQGKE